ncbi:hypothetical protein QTJ16_000311 [Diplocarpon rosae]|uniref:Altered inheritance of mitochondria protein 6 n=1 Tax=Diplocarpon rosae TaxID=946125 RepID=A0AAD9WHB2_9HELO|nr:hypothetical protein QTJ16_000311 [Diplocarpon rosae]
MAAGLKETVVEIEEGVYNASSARQGRRKGCVTLLRQSFHHGPHSSPWPMLVRRMLYLSATAIALATIISIIFHALILVLIQRLSPPRLPSNGVDKIVADWVEPESGKNNNNNSNTPSWLPNFSRGILPKPIHSHNDYWRRVPLFEALSLGITGVEADCHLIDGELYVGHTNKSLRASRTLKSLYLDPLFTILQSQNQNQNSPDPASSLISNANFDSSTRGIWDASPSTSLILLTDLKTSGSATLAAVQAQLAPFRARGWLTYWNGSAVVPGAITHVGTGNTPFASILDSEFANATYRDVFFDAPLDALLDTGTSTKKNTERDLNTKTGADTESNMNTDTSMYNISNSYYASTSIDHGIGVSISGLTSAQLQTVTTQVSQARALGLVSRYWDVPAWPVGRMVRVWAQLEEVGVGVLNADLVEVAARWDWKSCDLWGFGLC